MFYLVVTQNLISVSSQWGREEQPLRDTWAPPPHSDFNSAEETMCSIRKACSLFLSATNTPREFLPTFSGSNMDATILAFGLL